MRLVLDSLAPMSSLSATTPHLRVLSEVSAHTCELMERHDATTLIAPANPHTVRMETSIGKTLVGRAELVAISPSELHMLSLDGPRGLYPSAHPMLGIKWIGSMLLGYCLAVFLASDFEQLTWGSRSGALKFYRTYFERLGEYMGPLGLGVSPAGGDFTLAKVRPAASASLAA